MSRPAIAHKRPVVLVADDDRLTRTITRDALAGDDCEIVEADCGANALEAYERTRPSVVILDLNMPDPDGFAVCAQIRDRYAADLTPILVLSAADSSEAFDRAYGAGATDFMRKPINERLLRHRVHHLLSVSRTVADLRRSQRSLGAAQRIARLGSWEWNSDTDEMHWSDETYRIYGVEPGAAKPSFEAFWEGAHPDERAAVREEVEEALRVAKRFNVEYRVQLADGSVRNVHQRGEVVPDDGRTGSWISGTIQDVTEQIRAQEKIRFLASYDHLTGLANRHLFHELLSRATAAASSRGHQVGLLYIDLDHFKRINDTLGHAAGDQLLQTVAERLRDNVRGGDVVSRVQDDAADPAVSRLGGDEFTVILSEISEPEDAGDVARRILRVLPEMISLDGHEVSVSASIGIVLYPMDGDDVETLVRHADAAMYHAKEHGRNQYEFFSESMNAASLRKLTLETQLREALERDQFTVLYQPRLDVASDKMIGVEALLRWDHPELGSVAPKEFIPLCEETGLIVSIGEWVLRTACAQNKAWQRAGYDPIQVSVNVSTRQFAHHDLKATVTEALRESGLSPDCLELELTESLMLQEDDGTAATLHELRGMGVKIALDDFGTGYSSMSYVIRFPLDALKIDRCIVQNVGSDPAAAGVFTALVSMAHSLSLRVVAEGVDAEDQVQFLRENGCDEMQGFLMSAAVSPEELIPFLEGVKRSETD
ncbi:MAG: EAL domain-containing protein [Myxococcota bacterium]